MASFSGVAHIGLTVTDIERSIKFYCDMLDFELFERCTLEEDEGTTLIAFVRSGNLRLELKQPAANAVREDGRVDHIAINTDDIEAAHRELLKKGLVFETPEICSKDDIFERGTKWLIFRGPDGEHLELAQVL